MKVNRQIELGKFEIRQDGNKRTLSGYGAVFFDADNDGTTYQLGPNTFERFMPGAFDGITINQDVLATYNHDVNQPLGRTPKTLRLSVDEVGLRYEIDLPDTQLGREIQTHVENDTIRGSSVTMSIDADDVEREDGRVFRSIKAATIHEVGPVLTPAYAATSTEMRAIDERAERLKRIELSLAKLDK